MRNIIFFAIFLAIILGFASFALTYADTEERNESLPFTPKIKWQYDAIDCAINRHTGHFCESRFWKTNL